MRNNPRDKYRIRPISKAHRPYVQCQNENCGTKFGRPAKRADCKWIGHHSIRCDSIKSASGEELLRYWLDLGNGEEVQIRGVFRLDSAGVSMWTKHDPFFGTLFDKAREVGEELMANLYGSMSGNRTAGLVGNEEMAAQIQTGSASKQTGMLRLYVHESGYFEVYLADGDGDNGLLLLKGDVPKKAVTDADGNSIKVKALASKLEPIIVRNRKKQYTQQPAAQAPPAQPATPVQPRRAKAQPTTGKSVAAPVTMPSAKAKAAAKAKAEAKKAAPKKQKTVKAKLPEVGEFIKLIAATSGDLVKLVGQAAEVESVKEGGMMGVQIGAVFPKVGARVLFPDQGDLFTVVGKDEAEKVAATVTMADLYKQDNGHPDIRYLCIECGEPMERLVPECPTHKGGACNVCKNGSCDIYNVHKIEVLSPHGWKFTDGSVRT